MLLTEETEMFVGVVGMAMFGGFVSWMRNPKGKRVVNMVAHVLISAFAGLEAHFITSWLGMDAQFQFAAAGMAGYGGGALLDAVWPVFVERVSGLLRRKNESR